jgi:acyl-coenzyme A synthetase/AMP-(fatty) acid ligase
VSCRRLSGGSCGSDVERYIFGLSTRKARSQGRELKKYARRIEEFARLGPDRPAITCGDRNLTYGQFRAAIARTAGWLEAQGIQPGDTVAVDVTDEVDNLVVSSALLWRGAWQLGLAARESLEYRREALRRVGAQAIVSDRQYDVAPEQDIIAWSGIPSGHMADPVVETGGIFYATSGSTGKFSLIAMTQAQLGWQTDHPHCTAEDRYFSVAPMDFSIGKRARLFAGGLGAHQIFKPTPQIDAASFILDSDITLTDISSVVLGGLTARSSRPRQPNLRFRTVGVSVSRDQRLEFMARVAPSLEVRYGTTECGWIANAWPEHHKIDGALGTVLPGVEVRIVDDSGADVPIGQTGEMLVRAPGMVTGYHEDAERTAARFIGGYFRPGDLVSALPDGALVFHGRKDHMMNLSGIKIFPAEIEQALRRHPSVADAVAFPLQSATHGQIPVAAIEVVGPSTKLMQDTLRAELIAQGREVLGLRAPRQIAIFDHLPRTPTGKVRLQDVLSAFKEHL